MTGVFLSQRASNAENVSMLLLATFYDVKQGPVFLYLALRAKYILCKTVGLPSSTGESERTARRQFHSPTLRCFRGRLQV